MKKIFGLILIGAVFAGCGKKEVYSEDFSAALFINAAPSATAASTFYVVVDGVNQTTSSVAFKSNSGYLNIAPGNRNILVQSAAALTPPTFANLPTQGFETNTSSTYVVYDTLATPSSPLKVIRLSDDLTAPAAGFVKFRSLPLAPLAPAMDITYLRTNVTPNDSVTVTNLVYPGAAPSQAAINKLAAFTTLPAGAYALKYKLAGTQTVYASATYTPSVGGINKGIYTFYTTGTAQGQAFGINLIRNYP